MQLIGHELVEYDEIKFIKNSSELCDNCMFEFNKDFIKIAKEKKIEFSLVCDQTKEAIIANAVGAKFIVCEKNIASTFSNLAEFYMFDSKIACIISSEDEIEELTKLKVDTAIFKKGIINGDF